MAELGLADARVIGSSFLGKERGTPSVEMKRVRKGLIAKELASGRCGEECVRSWK